MFLETFSTARAAKIHIAKNSKCRATGSGLRTVVVESRPSDTMAGGSGAAGPLPDLRHQPPGLFSVKKSRGRYKHRLTILIYSRLRYIHSINITNFNIHRYTCDKHDMSLFIPRIYMT